jgi:hypothetical protein
MNCVCLSDINNITNSSKNAQRMRLRDVCRRKILLQVPENGLNMAMATHLFAKWRLAKSPQTGV